MQMFDYKKIFTFKLNYLFSIWTSNPNEKVTKIMQTDPNKIAFFLPIMCMYALTIGDVPKRPIQNTLFQS